MNVRFLGNSKIYQLEVIVPALGLVQLCPPLPSVDLKAGFELLTNKGKVYGNYLEYNTIYQQMEDGSIILSNDGTVYSPPEPEPEPIPEPEPEPEPIELTLEELKEQKKQEISEACEYAIYSGITVMLPSGVEHFSLTEKDQLNLFGKQAQLAAGAERLEYHQDGYPCRYYTAEEMQLIIMASMEHVSYHTTYCNALNMWIAGGMDAEELAGIFYGADVPEAYQSEVLKDYLIKIMSKAGEEVKESEAVS